MFHKSKVIIQTKMNMKRKPSLNKVNEKKLSVTAREMFWPQQQKPLLKEKESIQKLPPIRRTLRNVSAKTVTIQPIQARKQTQTTLNESTMMFQSMYGGKDWLKPSDYVKEIAQLNLLGQQKNVQAKSFDINLTQKFQKNLQKYGRLKEVTQKWVQVLKKALSYIKSTRASSDKLVEQVKFWKILSRKYDQLQYEFNIKDEKTTTLLAIMKKVLKSQPMYRPLLEQFLALKQEIVNMTPSIKKLYLQLEEVVSGFIIKLQQCSDIVESISLLKNILIAFDSIYHDNPLIRGRFIVICEKIDQCMTQKLIATSLYPRQLANISSVKQNYQIIDQSLSFYSHFINLLQSTQIIQGDLIQKIQYSRQVVGNLLQILIFFQHLYKNKQVNQFSKLFCHPLDYNIYDRQNSEEWNNYMDIVNQSMEKHNFQP